MKRRDFFKLAIASLLAACSPKGSLTMLPNTNRYGDLLREFYHGMKNDNLSNVRLDEIVRLFNELSQREDVYRTWLNSTGRIDFSKLNLPFEPIYSSELEDDKSELVIPIPSKFNHLLIMGQASLVGTGIAAQNIFAQFNGDTGASNYSYQEIYAANTTLTGQQDLTYDKISIGVVKADAGTAYYSGSFYSFIPHYTNKSYYKEVLRNIGYYSGAGAQINNAVFLWKSLDPIESMRLFPDTTTYPNAKIEAGSLISVYGLF